MRKKLSLKLLSIVTVTLGLILYFQQSQACKRLIDENMTEQLNKRKRPKSHTDYSNFRHLSEETLFHRILPQCNKTIIQVNCFFFTLITGYESSHIFDEGFDNKPTKPVCCLLDCPIFDFNKHLYHIEKIPSFVWYSLIRKVKNIPLYCLSYLGKSQIHTVNLSFNKIGDESMQNFCQSLQGSQIQTVKLSGNQIGDKGMQAFKQKLQGTQVQTINLSDNKIGNAGAHAFGQSLQGTQVYNVDLSRNQIGDEGIRDFSQSLKGTQVQTIDLRGNKIRDEGLCLFGQNLQGTQVRTVNLSDNEIGDYGARTFGQSLQDTQVHTVDLSANDISHEGALMFIQTLQRTQVQKIKR